jgi:predicted dinucleotide-binding enzyme
MTTIAIIGSGQIGRGLARAWRRAERTIVFGAREPNGPELVALANEIGASRATIAEAIERADVVTLAMPFDAIDGVAASGSFENKIVIDCANALARRWALKYGHTTSGAEEIAKKLPGARVYKSFNAQGAENLADPIYGGVRASNFFCGDHPDGKKLVASLIEDVGFEAVDAGPLENARLLEPLMLLWIAASQTTGTRDIAFKLLRRS